MPLKDYECPTLGCDRVILDRLEPTTTEAPPDCPVHQIPMERLWLPSSSYAPFREFTFQKDDGTVVRVDSMKAVRDIERESESGPRPTIFRDFSQDRSNLDRNVFQSLHPQVRAEELRRASRRRGRKIIDVGAVEISVAEEMAGEGE